MICIIISDDIIIIIINRVTAYLISIVLHVFIASDYNMMYSVSTCIIILIIKNYVL